MEENSERKRITIAYRTKVVETLTLLPFEERMKEIENNGFNVMNLRAENVFMDFCTDTACSAFSSEQFSRIIAADESYVKPSAFYKFESTVRSIFGFEFVLPTHQGRGGQQIIDFVLAKPDCIIPGNGHFWTVTANVQLNGGEVVDCLVPYSPSNKFGGNLDVDLLEETINKYGTDRIPYILISLTCNVRGGQPVSIQNIKDVSNVAKKHGILLIADCARFAENSCLIQNCEPGFASKPIREIVKEMFSYFDACIMSGKKDGLVSTGGFVGVRDPELNEKLKKPLSIFEGHLSNGGMSSATMESFAKGLKEVTTDAYCGHRREQINYLGSQLVNYGIPIVKPFGGHGFVIDARKFFPNIAIDEYPAYVLAAEVYKEGGIRIYPHRVQSSNTHYDICNISIPRRVYSSEHFDYIIDVVRTVFETKSTKLNKGFFVDPNRVDTINPNFLICA